MIKIVYKQNSYATMNLTYDYDKDESRGSKRCIFADIVDWNIRQTKR